MSADMTADAEDTRAFLDAIYARYGYDLRGYAAASIRRRVAAALSKAGLTDVGELRARCLEAPGFFAEVLESLTVKASDMFRDPAFFRTLCSRLTPMLRTYPRLDIWVCGCATGEEAYSLAILLCEAGLYDRCQIYATDLSPRALACAKTGVYPLASVSSFGESYRQAGGTSQFASYYTAAYDRIAIREQIRSNIVFFEHDLVNDYPFGQMQVVLCRNVMIYFGRELQDKVLGKLAAGLRPGGFLCLGASERLPRSAAPWFEDFAPDERIYRRSAQAVRQ
jgi:chemotaxis protein methyltransferase CheR